MNNLQKSAIHNNAMEITTVDKLTMHKAIHSSHQGLGEVGVKTDFTGCIFRKPLTWNGLQLIPEWDIPPHGVLFKPEIYNHFCEKSNNRKKQAQYILNDYMLYVFQ